MPCGNGVIPFEEILFLEFYMIRAGILVFFFFPVGLYAQIPCPSMTFCESFQRFGNRERDRIFTDYGNLYNQNSVKNFGVVLLGAGAFANTKMDGNFQNWYGNHVRSDLTDSCSKVSKVFGEGQFFIPIMAASALTYRFWQERRGLPECALGEFTDRTMRGYLAGAPALFVLQPILGGNRPYSGTSFWKPFQENHGISGHAFMGAVPFMTAAQMTDKPCVKGLFYALSTLPAWSRVNDDAHYFSQALLGWYLAYLSVRAVSATEGRGLLPRGMTIFPICGSNEVGIVLHCQF